MGRARLAGRRQPQRLLTQPPGPDAVPRARLRDRRFEQRPGIRRGRGARAPLGRARRGTGLAGRAGGSTACTRPFERGRGVAVRAYPRHQLATEPLLAAGAHPVEAQRHRGFRRDRVLGRQRQRPPQEIAPRSPRRQRRRGLQDHAGERRVERLAAGAVEQAHRLARPQPPVVRGGAVVIRQRQQRRRRVAHPAHVPLGLGEQHHQRRRLRAERVVNQASRSTGVSARATLSAASVRAGVVPASRAALVSSSRAAAGSRARTSAASSTRSRARARASAVTAIDRRRVSSPPRTKLSVTRHPATEPARPRVSARTRRATARWSVRVRAPMSGFEFIVVVTECLRPRPRGRAPEPGSGRPAAAPARSSSCRSADRNPCWPPRYAAPKRSSASSARWWSPPPTRKPPCATRSPSSPPATWSPSRWPRNTAAAVGLGAVVAAQRGGKDAVIAVLPADPFIADEAAFASLLRTAIAEAGEAITTIGVRPTHPETGFGYIRLGARLPRPGAAVYDVGGFVEKPDRPTAERYLASGDYLWNSGMFFLTARPDARGSAPPPAGIGRGAGRRPRRQRPPPRSSRRATLTRRPSPSITGSWRRRPACAWCPASSAGTTSAAGRPCRWSAPPTPGATWCVGKETAVLESDGNIIVAEEGAPYVGVLGVRDLVVVATRDAVLVIPKDRAQDVRQLVEAAKKAGRSDLL